MEMETRKMALDKVYKRRDRYDIPEWQRDEVWSLDRKQQLIDSILRGWRLPKFYFARTSEIPAEYDVVDGQQRLSTIFEFYDGELHLSPASSAEFGGATYSTLPEQVSDRFDDFEIDFDEITGATDQVLQKFFQRLQGGMQLMAAERLNSVTSELTKFSRRLAKHPFFTASVAIRDTRKAYFDIASKALAIEVDGMDVGLRYDDLKAVFESQQNFSNRSNVALRMQQTLDYLNEAFPTTSKVLRNRSTIQSIVTLAARVVESGNSDSTQRDFHLFVEDFGAELARQVELGQRATDMDFLEFQRTLSANVKAGPKLRHEVLLRKLLLFDSSWAETLGTGPLASANMSSDIDRLGLGIAELVRIRNEEYSATNGSDLFKATNKTASALGRLRKSISTFEEYTRLVDDLYFLFHEGHGQRLVGKVPVSFEDVNLLRTELQHDVDHGKAASVRAKRKKIGQAFAKYAAGVTSPSTLAPERFPIVQAALLKAIEADLRQLQP
jgi:uncharacterized protein DUF262